MELEPVNVEIDIDAFSLKSLYKIYDELTEREADIKNQRKYLKQKIQERLDKGETPSGNTTAPGTNFSIGA